MNRQDRSTVDDIPPVNEPKYDVSSSLCYADGRSSREVAYQKRRSIFCVTQCGFDTTDVNSPGENWTNVRLANLDCNPRPPQFKRGTQFIDLKTANNISRTFQLYAGEWNATCQS